MTRIGRWVLVGCALSVAGCSLITNQATFGGEDGGTDSRDASTDAHVAPDAGDLDAGPRDAGTDAGPRDAGPHDAGPCGECGEGLHCDPASLACVECLENAHCDDGDPCTSDVCTIARTCDSSPIPACVVELEASAQWHTCARRNDGRALCWGRNNNGQLGDASTTDRSTPVNVLDSTWTQISAGSTHTCGLRSGGSVICWGNNYSGQLGNGTVTNLIRPGTTSITGLNAVEVRAGGSHTCARRADGTLACWGSNSGGQLGNGSRTEEPTTRPFNVSSIADATQLALGSNHTCALRATGEVACWGHNSQGQVGTGSTTSYVMTPTTVAGLSDVVEVSAGNALTCARRATGEVVCWGENQYGQIGDGTTTRRPSPTPVMGLTNATAIAAGQTHACALRSGGQVVCWGQNNFGQLGDGSMADRSTAVAVVGLSARSITAGSSHTCARRMTGESVCWGYNYYGQLGVGSTTNQSMPGADITFP